ncbi:unnamed protein product, partial [Choristocarpus tenellus]
MQTGSPPHLKKTLFLLVPADETYPPPHTHTLESSNLLMASEIERESMKEKSTDVLNVLNNTSNTFETFPQLPFTTLLLEPDRVSGPVPDSFKEVVKAKELA